MRFWCDFPRWWRRRGKALTAAALTTSSRLSSAAENTQSRHASHTPPRRTASRDTQSARSSDAGEDTLSLASLPKKRLIFEMIEKHFYKCVAHSNRSWVYSRRRAARRGIPNSCRPRRTCAHTPRGETAEHTLAAGTRPRRCCSLHKHTHTHTDENRWRSINCIVLISTTYFIFFRYTLICRNWEYSLKLTNNKVQKGR